MDRDFTIKINESTFQKLTEIKEKMGFANKDWNEWFDELFEETLEQKSTIQTIEEVFQKNIYEKYYDDWIRNFALNLGNILDGHSVRELMPQKNSLENPTPAIVIGRGPSIQKHHHLDLLANSTYNSTIVCCDGALINTLKAGVTPDKFKNFFVVTIDTQEHIRNLYDDPIVNKFGNKIKCILSTTAPITTYNIVKKSGMEIFWIHTLFDYNKGKTSFNHISGVMAKSKNHEKGIPAIQTGGNVGTSSWMISWSILKCSPVVLIGIDHGYPAEISWEEIDKYHKIPADVDKNSEVFKKAYPTLYNPEFNCHFKQDPIFQYYSNAFKEFIPRAPSWVQTINATEGGAIFGEGISCIKFHDFLKRPNKGNI